MDKVKKYYIFGGCSFTAMPNSWARRLQQLINPDYADVVACAGGGNNIVANRVLFEANRVTQEGYKPVITIMWTHPGRVDHPLDSRETPYYKVLFDQNKKDKDNFNPTPVGDSWWLLDCGNADVDFTRIHDETRHDYVKAFKSYKKYLWNSTSQWNKTLQAILLIQSICEANNWEYEFTVFNEFMKYYVHLNKSMPGLSNFVKWDKFTFTNDDYGGLREYTLDNLNTWDDGYDCHPSHEAQKDFLDNFWLVRHSKMYENSRLADSLRNKYA